MWNIDILTKVRHEHIVSLHDIYESADAVYIVTDLCTGGELFQRIVERGTYTEAMASDLVRQMLEGLAYLHSEGVSFLLIEEGEFYFLIYSSLKLDCSPRYKARKRKFVEHFSFAWGMIIDQWVIFFFFF